MSEDKEIKFQTNNSSSPIDLTDEIKPKLDNLGRAYATGRRKRSIARVWIKKGSGKIYVNGKDMNQYFKRPVHQLIVVMPLQETNAINKFDVKCHVKGGGLSGQAGAIIHGISRALIKSDANLKKTLKKNKFTTRDSRTGLWHASNIS